jgi:DNA-binding transcriptional MerR regulator/methylmalonyl-CoA mutase cobalamin-binding subunit
MNDMPVNHSPGSAASLHPIQVVSRRTGLSPDVIRAWERRYNAVTPCRTATDRRLYSDADVERLRLLRRATETGRRIGDVAHLPLGELEGLLEVDRLATVQPPSVAAIATAETVIVEHVEACLMAVQVLDPVALDRALAVAARALSVPQLLYGVLAPLLERIGDGWRQGKLRPCHEHLASSQLRFFLGDLVTGSSAGDDGPTLVVTTPSGQRHEMGALFVAVLAAQAGWNPLYLGPDTPGDEIAFAAMFRQAPAIALSISYPADDPRLAGALRRLRQQLPESVQILVGGAAADGYQDALTAIGALRPPTLDAFRTELDRLRGSR